MCCRFNECFDCVWRAICAEIHVECSDRLFFFCCFLLLVTRCFMAKLNTWSYMTVQEAQCESGKDPQPPEVRCRLVVQERKMQSTKGMGEICKNTQLV